MVAGRVFGDSSGNLGGSFLDHQTQTPETSSSLLPSANSLLSCYDVMSIRPLYDRLLAYNFQSPFDFITFFYMMLFFAGANWWICLMILWRGTRFFNLLAGIDSPESMLACIYLNVGFTDLWRTWHAALNLFVIKYIYVPLGGASAGVFVLFASFAFTAYTI